MVLSHRIGAHDWEVYRSIWFISSLVRIPRWENKFGALMKIFRKLVMKGIKTALFFGLCCFLCACEKNSHAKNNMEQQIRTLIDNEVHRGDSKNKVIDFLNTHKIEHSNPEDVRFPTLTAILRGGNGSNFIQQNIQVFFVFDESSRLTDYTINNMYTGP